MGINEKVDGRVCMSCLPAYELMLKEPQIIDSNPAKG